MKTIDLNTWNKTRLIKLLDTNDTAVARAVVRIYQNQTPTERAVGTTVQHNNVGFSAADAKFLSSLAWKYQQYGKLSQKQTYYARRGIKKYWRQILNYMESQGYKVDYS